MDKYPEFVNPYIPSAASLFVRVEHLARYLYAADYMRKHRLKTVLDCACGDGYGCRILAGRAQEVIGVERDAARVDAGISLEATSAAGGITYHVTDVNIGLPMLKDASLDCVTCFETLEHVENDMALLREFRRVLRRGGRLLLSIPKAGYEPADAAGRPENPHHLRLYAPDELKQTLEDCGFAVDKELGQPYANALHRRSQNYFRDTGNPRADIAAYFNESPQALEFYARVWAWPEEELPEKSNAIFYVCRRKP